mmetsp:Transcript_19/g.10  ORF Transcript_19/g.10 Transcript_19/m.10 type:complete len:139 (+) Transcript_19:72-488(+)
MGQNWSNQDSSIGDAALIRQSGDPIGLPNETFGVEGKLDPKVIQKVIEEAAVQVYEDVHQQLRNLQEESISVAQQTSKQLQNRLQGLERSDASQRQVCGSQRSVLLRCLQDSRRQGSRVALSCDEAVQAYQSCSLSDG